MTPLAIIGALAIGLSLGMLGSGGSILTVPALIYLAGQSDKVAIAGSLAIVGAISLFGAIPYARKGLIDWRSVGLFAPPGMVGTWIGAWISRFIGGDVQLLVFAAVMLLVAVLMFRGMAGDADRPPVSRAFWKIALDGLAVGIVTGLVGVGGGFLIIPALVLLGGLRMQTAVGTSLLVIALKSGSGFVKYLDVLGELGLRLDWEVIGLFTGIGTLGSFAGNFVATRIPHHALRRAFGALLVVMAAWILYTRLVAPAPTAAGAPALNGAK